jgi:hypothetical protein
MDDLVEIIRQPILVFRQRTEALLRSLKFADFARNIGVFEGLKTGRRHDTPFGLRWSREWPLLNLGYVGCVARAKTGEERWNTERSESGWPNMGVASIRSPKSAEKVMGL